METHSLPAASSRVHAAALERFAAGILTAAGLPAADAREVAMLIVRADLGGAEGHGVFRLPQYVRRILAGGINREPRIRATRERDAMALLDGDNGMGHLVMKAAAQKAIEKALSAGVGWVGVNHSNHARPASLYATMPMERDMIGLYLAVGNANHLPPWGGIDMLLSTNPIAVAVPAQDEPPIVLDMASTVAAYGKVKTKAQRGESMPEGWMIDRAAARANPGRIFYAAGGNGSPQHIAMALFASTAGVSMTHVPYKGATQAAVDVAGGQVPVALQGLATVSSLVRGNKLRLLGVTTHNRLAQFPDVPTVSESGLPGFEFNSWFAIMAPAGTPKDIVGKLNAEIVRVLSDPAVRQQLNDQGLTMRGSSAEELRIAPRDQLAKYARLIKQAGITIE